MTTKLFDLLPPKWRIRGLLPDIAEAVGQRWDYWRTLIGALPSFFEAEGAPSEWLDWLMHLVGHIQRKGLSDRRKRNLIAKSGEIWRKKGTAEGIELYLQALVGVEVRVVNENTHAFVASVSKAGDVCGPGELAHKYRIERPADVDLSDAELRELLKLVAPANRQYRVCDLDGGDCSSYQYPAD